jgi:hypothetical protein
MNFRAVQIEQSDPVLILLQLENLLRRTEHTKRFGKAAQLHQRHSIKRGCLRLFVTKTELFELLSGANSERGGVVGKVQLEIDFGFVEVAQRAMPHAS